MVEDGSPWTPTLHQVGMSYVDVEVDVTVVWLTGEHDIATAASLSETMGHAVRLGDADVVVDLGAVEFMGASTLGAIIGARTVLGRQRRLLTLRAPSRSAKRVLDACGFAYVDSSRVEAVATMAPSGGP